MNEIDLHAELPIEQLKLDTTPEQRERYRKFYETDPDPKKDEDK